jgi:hypothetical protein
MYVSKENSFEYLEHKTKKNIGSSYATIVTGGHNFDPLLAFISFATGRSPVKRLIVSEVNLQQEQARGHTSRHEKEGRL